MAETRRLFFALWPPAAVCRALAGQADAAGCGGRTVTAERLHLTLAFLGDVDAGRIDPLRSAAAGIACPPFVLNLDRLGHFPRAGVAWLGPSATPESLVQLAGDVRDAAADAGVALRSSGFRPHVTLARRAGPPVRRYVDSPLRWEVEAFSLTQSMHMGGRAVYRDLGCWSLHAGAEPARSVK